MPVAVLAAKVRLKALWMSTLAPVKATVPLKLFPVFVSRILLPVAFSVALPPTVKAPVCVSAPPLVNARVPVALEAATASAVLSVRATLAPVKPTVPPKLLPALLSVMSVPVKAALPLTAKAPVCVIAADETAFSVPVAVLAAKARAVLSNRATLAPVKPNVPPKLLPTFVSVMSVPVKVALPPVVSAPV